MNRTEMFVHEETIAVAAPGDETTFTIKGPTDPGLAEVRLDYLSHDEGKIDGTVQDQVQVKIQPKRNTAAFGGDQYHTFYALPSQNNQRNVFRLGHTLKPGEDLTVVVKAQDVGTIIVRVQGTKVFA